VCHYFSVPKTLFPKKKEAVWARSLPPARSQIFDSAQKKSMAVKLVYGRILAAVIINARANTFHSSLM